MIQSCRLGSYPGAALQRRARIAALSCVGVVVLALPVMMVSCAPRAVVAASPEEHDSAPTGEPTRSPGSETALGQGIPAYSEVIILPPVLKFERLLNEEALDPSGFDGAAISGSLDAAARRAVEDGGYRLARPESLAERGSVDPLHDPQLLSLRVSAGLVNAEAMEVMRRLSTQNPNLVILSHSIHAKVVPGSVWDTDHDVAGGPDRSTSRLRIALTQCASGHILWKSEVLLRGQPKAAGSRFAKAVRLLYANFPGARED